MLAGPACLAMGTNRLAVDALWHRLKAGRHVVLLRHASTGPGIGDPPGFRLGDCSTQRNLSQKGRDEARAIGAAFTRRTIPLGPVLSSRWCRCQETARLAFGRVEPAPMLDSMFSDDDYTARRKVYEVLSYVAGWDGAANLVLVTHAVNIQELTGQSIDSGEIVVAVPRDRKLKAIGRLVAQSP
jgi:phosphohistidine phosphatase SixA